MVSFQVWDEFAFSGITVKFHKIMMIIQEEYNAAATRCDAADAADIHEGIGEHVERHVDPSERDWNIKVPSDIEESLGLALKCIQVCRFSPSGNDLLK